MSNSGSMGFKMHVVQLMVSVAIAAGAIGCQQSAFEVAPVHGKVTIGSQPLLAGKVMFAPVAAAEASHAGKSAVGVVQPDGSFTLTTFDDGDGAIIGEHWVTVFVPKKSPALSQALPEAAAAEVDFKRIAVPTKQVVAAGQDNQIEIKL